MTYPLMALAVGAIVAGFIGIPAALGGGNEIEHFLEPSFTPSHAAAASAVAGRTEVPAAEPAAAAGHAEPAEGEHAGEHVSPVVEIGLMVFSLIIAVAGISLAYQFYIAKPEVSERLAEQFAGAHRTLSNKYYVDELYNGTVIGGTMASGRGLWTFDRNVVDGAVNGTSNATVVSSWFSGATDRTIVDGLVNLVGWIVQESSHAFRRFQTGLVQNYAMLMLFGIFAFMSLYLFIR
jgi:NADH-quinone oxidoreductase subunit L